MHRCICLSWVLILTSDSPSNRRQIVNRLLGNQRSVTRGHKPRGHRLHHTTGWTFAVSRGSCPALHSRYVKRDSTTIGVRRESGSPMLSREARPTNSSGALYCRTKSCHVTKCVIFKTLGETHNQSEERRFLHPQQPSPRPPKPPPTQPTSPRTTHNPQPPEPEPPRTFPQR